jgi:hypothetical protein
MLSVDLLNGIMLGAVILYVIMLSVNMQKDIMLNVAAPIYQPFSVLCHVEGLFKFATFYMIAL